jgi:hypothetical protein
MQLSYRLENDRSKYATYFKYNRILVYKIMKLLFKQMVNYM